MMEHRNQSQPNLGARPPAQPCRFKANADRDAINLQSDGSSNKWRRDETATVISVNEDLFSCAVDIWENWQKCLPPNFRKDKVWDVALFPKDSGLR